mmetsp:Transcript_124421/g.311100  ORF Transcript_124421/g.311100 Transcript_124421/m.311100 type:complete len:275 (-) Transcript_124421:42-866(-)
MHTCMHEPPPIGTPYNTNGCLSLLHIALSQGALLRMSVSSSFAAATAACRASCLLRKRALMRCLLSCLRRFSAPSSQRWQNGHAGPLAQPVLWKNAHGLQVPDPCFRDPTDDIASKESDLVDSCSAMPASAVADGAGMDGGGGSEDGGLGGGCSCCGRNHKGSVNSVSSSRCTNAEDEGSARAEVKGSIATSMAGSSSQSAVNGQEYIRLSRKKHSRDSVLTRSASRKVFLTTSDASSALICGKLSPSWPSEHGEKVTRFPMVEAKDACRRDAV